METDSGENEFVEGESSITWLGLYWLEFNTLTISSSFTFCLNKNVFDCQSERDTG